MYRVQLRWAMVVSVTLLIGTMAFGCRSPQTELMDSLAVSERAVEAYYGSLLETVVVGPKRESDCGSGRELYMSEYRLKDIPLSFTFAIAANTMTLDSRSSGGAYGERSLMHEDIGGIKRFYSLASEYHRDFPQQTSMSYWCTSDNGVSSQEPYVSILRRYPGLSVNVYSGDDYWGDGVAEHLGIYWWNEREGRWLLVHRGALPDMR